MFQKLFARLYDRGMSAKERKYFSKRRRALLAHLTGDVLEVGSGTGINFQYYNQSVCVTALEPSIYMHEKALSRMKDNHIHVVHKTIHGAIADQDIGDCQFDHVVCTLVLCSVPEPQQQISSLIRLLKPGGSLIVIEHIQANNEIIRFLQHIWNPIQNCIADGCNCNRRTDEYIRSTLLTCTYEEYVGRWKTYYVGVYRKRI